MGISPRRLFGDADAAVWLRWLTHINLFRAAHSLEDLPPAVRDQGRLILSTPTGLSVQAHDFDVVENAVLDTYGHLELIKVLRFLSRYPVTNYVYQVSRTVSRGSRPDAAKISALYKSGVRHTINLCAEDRLGDDPAIASAHLTGKMETDHVGIVDMTPPGVDQMVEILDLIARYQRNGSPVFIHCEAGKGRTGVVIACYRMAVEGWSVANAVTEARNFGDTVPMQEAFIQSFGRILQQQYVARDNQAPLPNPILASYPWQELGSTTPTPAQLTATVSMATRSTPGRTL